MTNFNMELSKSSKIKDSGSKYNGERNRTNMLQ